MIFGISPGCRGLQHENISNLGSSYLFLLELTIVKHVQQWEWAFHERKSLDPLCSAEGEMSSEIPEELYQAQFLRPLRHISSPSMH